MTGLEEALSDALSDEFHPFTNLDSVTTEQKNRAVAAASLLNNMTKGRGTKFRIDIKDENLLLEAVHVLDVLLKDKEWLKLWGQQSADKSEKIFKLRRNLLKKWNDAG